MQKILSLILALCMMISVFSVGIVSANAAEDDDVANAAAELDEAYEEVAAELEDLTAEVSANAIDEASVGATEEVADTDATEEAADTAATEEVADTSATEAVAETGDTEEEANGKWYGVNYGSMNLNSAEASTFIKANGSLKKGDLTIVSLDVFIKKRRFR